jgi:hypothetical protein
LAAGGRALHKALVIVPILGWVGVGALLHQTRGWPAVKSDEGVVVVLPARPTAQNPGATPQGAVPRASDRAGLARELHKELKRVGCYEGDISGAWTSTSRQAMRRFTDSVNAKLPFEEPDVVLLRLVQSQAQRVCACPAGAAEAAKACTDGGGAAEAAKKSPIEPRRDEASGQSSTPLIVGAAASTAAAATLLARPDANPTSAKPIVAQPSAAEEDNRAPRSPRQSGPTPPADVYAGRRSAAPRRAESRPPVVLQSLVRNVQRALGSIGIR